MIKIGIIGPNSSMCSEELFSFGIELGKSIAKKERIFICGGYGGFMEAVCKGIKESQCIFFGQTIGILTEDNIVGVNPHVDIAIPTGIGIARNIIIINTAEIIIAAGGGAGTLSELAFAWQKNKKVLCVEQFDGWAKKLANKSIDIRYSDLLVGVNSTKQINNIIDEHVKRFNAS